MKKYINFNDVFSASVIVMLLLAITSCSNEFHDPDFDGNSGPPVITSVASADTNTPVTTGVLNNTYYIKGQNLGSVKSIKYNGFNAGFNPVYVTNELIISRIPTGAPFLNVANKLVVETANGIAEYDFSLLTITDFDEQVIDGKNAVVLNGGDFTNADRVLFVSGTEELGNLEEREATILNKTADALTVEVPAGVVQAFIYVFNNGAIATSSSYGFNYPIFTDEVNNWVIGGWEGSFQLSDEVTLGATSIRRDSNNWGGLSFNIGDEADDLVIADYRTVSFQIFPANDETVRLAFALNDFETQVVLDLVPGEWNKFVVPLTDLYPPGTGPETITRMDFQEFSGGTAPFLFYLDQFGFIE